MTDSPRKRLIWLRGFLQGKGYFQAIEALELARKHHKGLRKDNVTPVLDHMVSIVLFVLGLKIPETVLEDLIDVILLHDIREDHGVSDEEIRSRFGDTVADAVECLTKEFQGVKKTPEVYFGAIPNNLLAAIGKAGDRFHNQDSMSGVFTLAKQREQTDETVTYIIPMLKTARRNFPQFELLFQSLKTALVSQVKLVEATLAAAAEATHGVAA